MMSSNHRKVLILAILIALAPFRSEAAAQTKSKPQKSANRADSKAKPQSTAKKPKPSAKGAGAALFVVMGDRADTRMEPLVGIIEGRLIEPPSAGSDTFTQFVSRYYRAGQKYRLLFGGGEAGTATVKSGPGKDSDCGRAQASVELETNVRINGLVMGLATGSASLGQKISSRRFPTPKEREAVSTIARGIFRQKGVAAPALENIKSINMTAMDLDGDGKLEIIASLIVRTVEKSPAVHHLFLVADPLDDGFDVGMMRYSRTTANDLPGGATLSDVDQAILTEVLVDQLDIDNDKAAEIITMTTSFEGATYKIYRKQKNQWANIYEFYSYRCAY